MCRLTGHKPAAYTTNPTRQGYAGKENEMNITRKTASYNARRYGRPWIARVTFDTNGKASYDWGNWIGTIEGGNGSAGELVITVNEGDIVATGHKDLRKGPANINYWLVRDGQLVHLDKAEAYRIYTAAPAA
jgi:hypothetical protein